MMRALKKDYDRYYSRKRNTEDRRLNALSEEEPQHSPPEIMVPHDFYQEVMVDNLKIKRRFGNFR